MSESKRILRWVRAGILAAMLASACVGVYFDIQRRFVSPGAIQATRRFVSIDQTLTDAGRNGPIGLQFVDCNGEMRQFAYFRAVYDLYPQPVVVVNRDAVVFDPEQIPDGIVRSFDWWRQHGVKTIVTVDQKRNSWEAAPTSNPSEPG